MNHLGCIRVFKRVVELGSFTKAADELRITQSCATKQVSQLERYLGVRLLDRSTRGLSITEDGLLYYNRWKFILAEIESADLLIKNRRMAFAAIR